MSRFYCDDFDFLSHGTHLRLIAAAPAARLGWTGLVWVEQWACHRLPIELFDGAACMLHRIPCEGV